MFLLKFFVLVTVIGLALSEVVNFRPCKDYTGSCVIHEVRINPCPQAANNEACKLRRRKKYRISFDFTPGFDSEQLGARAFWAKDTGDLELTAMDSNACNYAQCPVKKDQKNTYDFEVPISNKFPLNNYEIKWVLNGSGQECCFTTDIKLVR